MLNIDVPVVGIILTGFAIGTLAFFLGFAVRLMYELITNRGKKNSIDWG